MKVSIQNYLKSVSRYWNTYKPNVFSQIFSFTDSERLSCFIKFSSSTVTKFGAIRQPVNNVSTVDAESFDGFLVGQVLFLDDYDIKGDLFLLINASKKAKLKHISVQGNLGYYSMGKAVIVTII